MSEKVFKDFDTLYAHMFNLYQQGEYQQALDLMTREEPRFPDRLQDLRYARACMAGCLGQGDLVFELLGAALADGHWYGDYLWEDADFDSVRETAEFKRLRALSKERLDVVLTTVHPELLTILPAEPRSAPLLIALHGNTSGIRWHQMYWRGAVSAGWLVALPQSSQLSGQDSEGNLAFSWDDEATNTRELTAHFAALQAAYTPDMGRVVLGGFSRGAEAAIQVALTGQIPAHSVIAVCAGGPLSREPERWEPIIAQGQGRGLHIHVIMGGQDERFVPGTEKLVDMLHEAGISCELETHEEMGHDYPPDFADRLPERLAAVVEAS
jgi:predicted esterase